MKIIVETSTLIGACLFWKSGSHSIKHPQFDKCNSLFQFLERHPEVGIVTRTIENEAKGVLDKAVLRTIR